MASDSISLPPDVIRVVINVTDLNDNAPYFSQNPIVFGIPVDAQYGHFIGAILVNPTELSDLV